jgi:hypothetical protein
MVDKRQFYEESFQPNIISYNANSELTCLVQFGSGTFFGVPVLMSENVDIWIHEFVEHGIHNLLVEHGMPKSLFWIYREELRYFTWNQKISHIITAATCKSGLDGQTVDADTYWDRIMETYAKRLISG